MTSSAATICPAGRAACSSPQGGYQAWLQGRVPACHCFRSSDRNSICMTLVTCSLPNTKVRVRSDDTPSSPKNDRSHYQVTFKASKNRYAIPPSKILILTSVRCCIAPSLCCGRGTVVGGDDKSGSLHPDQEKPCMSPT